MLHTCTRNYAEIAGIMAMEAGQVDEHLVKAREQVAAILSALFQ
jgi:DNA-directed RNA polymerase specialized sigma24 family protein